MAPPSRLPPPSASSLPLPLLEDWLRSAATGHSQQPWPPSASSPPSAQQLAQWWSQLRDCVLRGAMEEPHAAAVLSLRACGPALHISDPQAKLLTCLLSPSSPPHALAPTALLLSLWLRKRRLAQHTEAIGGILPRVSASLQSHHPEVHSFIGEAILLMGALSNAVQSGDEHLKHRCHDAIALQFAQNRHQILQGSLEETLAGAGYALLSSGEARLREFVRHLLWLWSESAESPPPHADLLLLLHLMHWCGSAFHARGQPQSVALIADELLQVAENDPPTSVRCAVAMGAAGLLKFLQETQKQGTARGSLASAESNWQSIRLSVETLISSMAEKAVGWPQVNIIQKKVEEKAVELIEKQLTADAVPRSVCLLQNWLHETGLSQVSAASRYWLQCLSLSLAQCKPFPSHPAILLGLAVTLLNDAMPVHDLYTAQLMDLESALKNGCTVLCHESGRSEFRSIQEKLSAHMTGVLFREAGAITRLMCMQYQFVADPFQNLIRSILWEYSRVVYESHRLYSAVEQMIHHANSSLAPYSLNSGEESLKKMLETIFLFIVMFFSFTLKGGSICGEIRTAGRSLREEVAILDSFSCVELFRHVQLPDYGAAVLDCVAKVASSEAASTSLLQMLPLYENVIKSPGDPSETYIWNQDKVQTARLLFYFRVLPSCLENMPIMDFVNRAAPLMFLYLQHPSQSLTEASHALFATLLSTCPESELKHQSKEIGNYTIKERLVAFYMERVLEVFPHLTPFESLASGVGAIVQHLPPGSPAIIHCFCCIRAKASELLRVSCAVGAKQFGNCAAVKCQEVQAADTGSSDGEAAGKKLLSLIVDLMLFADLQVLPFLLREVANLTFELPSKVQMIALGDIFNVVTNCDDLTRKPILVPWLQTLSYLCTKVTTHDTINVAQVTVPSRL